MAYNAKERLEANIEAIKIVLEKRVGTECTTEEIEKLKTYCGFGGLKAVLFSDGPRETWIEQGASESDLKLFDTFQILYNLLRDNLTGREYKECLVSMQSSIQTAYFTPSVIPRTFYEVLGELGVEIGSIYDPSCGAGVFVHEAYKLFDLKGGVKFYEKDFLTAKILSTIYPSPGEVINKPFEESDNNENGKYSLIASNIPYGAISIFDPNIRDKNLCGKVHNYFFAKGLEKIKEGGLLAYLTTNAFLDTLSNRSAREYLFNRADFISLSVLPDNLMKDSANTEAPSHFLVVRKNTAKTTLSEEEKLLCESFTVQAGGIAFSLNRYCKQAAESIVIGDVSVGKNQYGKPSREVKWKGAIEDVGVKFKEILLQDFRKRYVGLPVPVDEVDDADFSPWEDLPLSLSDISNLVKAYLPIHQQQALVGSTEHWDILAKLEEVITFTPSLYSTENIKAEDKKVYLHYFYGGSDWYIVERRADGLMFGYANLGDDDCAEWGYVTFNELQNNYVDLDLHWDIKTFGEVLKEREREQEDTPPLDELEEIVAQFPNITLATIPRHTLDLNPAVPIKPGTFTTQTKKDQLQLFGDKKEIVQIDNCTEEQCTVSSPEMGKKEREVMEAYLKIRDSYFELEKLEKDGL